MTQTQLSPIQVAGLACPSCSSIEVKTTWQNFRDGSRHVRATCAWCNRFLRYLKQDGLPAPKVEMSDPRPDETDHPAYQPPPAGWVWLGFLRQSDQSWKPIAMSKTLTGCWDAMLSTWQRGDFLAMPARHDKAPTSPQDANGAAERQAP